MNESLSFLVMIFVGIIALLWMNHTLGKMVYKVWQILDSMRRGCDGELPSPTPGSPDEEDET